MGGLAARRLLHTVGERYLFLDTTNAKPAFLSSLMAVAIRSQLSYLRVMRARSLSIFASPL